MPSRMWLGRVFGAGRRSVAARPRRERADWYVPLEVGRLEERRVLNVAPVINGAGNLATVHQNEPASSISGSKVSDLIAGHVTDPDPGALSGIAVTAADNTHGTWQFSTDSGAHWTDFGAPGDSNARLLAADVNTYVRFVPAADFNGVVSPGITFRAWDQTSGTAGLTADTTTNGGTTAFSTTTAHSDITVDEPITITGAHTTSITDKQTASPFNGVTIADSISAVELISVTLTQSDLANGTLSNLGGFVNNLDGTYSFTGNAADATTALDGLLFTPTANQVSPGSPPVSTTFAIKAADAVTSTSDSNTIVSVASVNDAPVLDNTQTQPFTTITEDDLNNPGNTVASLLGMAQSDVDLNAVQGIAITSTSITLENGDVVGTKAWQYSTDGGMTWNNIGAVSDSQALLLRSTDLVRFLPDGYNGNTGSITYRAWDQTAGTAGTKADVSTNGGTTAYSTAAASSAITVTDVNDAPVLDNTQTQPFTTITEDDLNNPGNTVASLLGMAQSDVDLNAVQGIAITATSITLENGDVLGTKAWQYSTDGGVTWLNVGAVSDTQALLLRPTDLVRFLPDAKNGNTGSISYRAWDQTSGTAGAKVDVSINGGTTPYSTATSSSAITVTDVNDAPVLDNTKTQPFTTITEDDLNNPGNTVASLLGMAQSDVDLNAVQGIAITATSITLETGDVVGTKAWQYSTDGGMTWNNIGAVSDSQALLLRSTDLVRFVPDGKNGNTGSITYRAWDQTAGTAGMKADVSTNGGTTAYSTATASSAITVTDVNDAPVLDPAQTQPFTTITEDDVNNPGNTVASLLGMAQSDVDLNSVQGIAITATSITLESGDTLMTKAWQYSTDGGTTWNNIGEVSDSQALLLRSTDLVRFLPDGHNGNTGSMTYRAWDQTAGAAGTKADVSTNGGTTPYSTATASSAITVTDVNDAPVLDNTKTQPFTTITEDDLNNSGNTVASLLGMAQSDVDLNSVQGIAITATSITLENGDVVGTKAWQYSTDNGVTWNNIGAVSDTQALLLRSTDLVRFLPDGQNGNTGSITYRAWDQTAGAAGTKTDVSTNGGTTPYSTATASSAITVTDVNDAPVLDNTKTQPFTTITEDDLNNPGNTVASLLGMAQSDVDLNAVQGIAITATSITLENGDVLGTKAWQYSTDGGMTWNNIGAVSDTQALLLRSTDLVRFLPDGKNGNTGSITYRAWDQTAGTAGMKADVSTNGGTTPYSTATASSAITVTDVNDAPVLDNSKTQPFTTITEDDLNHPGNTVASLLGMAQSDVDLNAVQGIAITATSITLENGDVVGTKAWQYSTDGGMTWNNIGAVSDTQALLLRSTDLVRFLPDGQNGNTGSITYRAWDQTAGTAGTKTDVSINGGTTPYSTATASSAISVTDVNDAPVLDNTKTQPFTTITEDDLNNPGNTVASLLGMAQSDVDLNAVQGIAITATSITLENGDVVGTKAWQYSTDGGMTWNNIGAVSDTQALLLRSTDLVRFLPDGQNGNTGSITYRAWDQTAGAAGTKVDVSTNGGTTPYSTPTASSAISVTDVNDAPVLDNAKTQPFTTITEDDLNNPGNTVASLLGMAQSDVDLNAVQGIAITATSITLENGDVVGTKAWQYSTDGGMTWNNIGAVSESQALLLRSTDLVRFLPDGQNGNTGSITYRAWDQTAGTAGTKADVSIYGGTTPYSTATASSAITVTDVNDAPVLDNTKTQPFTTITEDDLNNPGNTVASLLGLAQSDVDLNAVQGIAITATSITLENGDVVGTKAWQYSTDGGTTWNNIGAVSDSQALLLRSTDLVRFLPDGQNGNTGSITYRAWDQTGTSAGQQGTKVDVSTNGGTTPYSRDTGSSAISVIDVNDVNDAPVLDPTKVLPQLTTITENDINNLGQTVASLLQMAQSDVDLQAVQGIAIVDAQVLMLNQDDVVGDKSWQFSIDGGMTWTNMGAVSDTKALLLRSTDLIRFLPDAKNGNTGSLSYRAWDQSGASAGQQGTKVDVSSNGGITPYSSSTAMSAITVLNVNDAPIMTPKTIFLPVTVDKSMLVDGIPEVIGSFGVVNGSPVGALPASSVDLPVVPFAWTIVSGNNGTFTIDPTTGALSVANATLFTFTPTKFDLNLSATENEFNSATVLPATSNENMTIAPWMVVTTATQVDSHFRTTLSIMVLSADPNQQFNGVIHWGDVQGDTTAVSGLKSGAVMQVVSPQYLTNPNTKNASAPIPISVTMQPTGVTQTFVVEDTARTVARIPGAGLASIKIVSTSGGGFVNVVLPTVTSAPNQAANQETSLSQSSDAGIASTEAINTAERMVFLRVVSPSEADNQEPVLRDSNVKDVPSLMVVSGGKAPSAFKLEDTDLNDLPGLFKKLPDGRYQVYLLEEGHLRLVIDVAVRQGRAVDPSGDSGGQDRPPTGHVEGADRDPLVEIKAQYQRAINAQKADAPEVPPLDSPLAPDAPKLPPTGPVETTAAAVQPHVPTVRLDRPADGRAPVNHTSRTTTNDDHWTAAIAATGGTIALGAATVLSREERIDRAMQRLDSRSLSKAGRLVRWLKKTD